mgnify:CR=1 FL=1
MYEDRFGTILESGDEITIDKYYATFSKCKEETGWIVLEFLEHETITEVVAMHTHGEIASFPLSSTAKKQDIKKFLNHIAPRSTQNG